MRIFTALYPSAEAVSDLARTVDPLRLRHGDLTWTRAEQWHLTLTFHPDLTDAELRLLEREVGRCAELRRATSVRIRGGGAFPAARYGNVVWAGVEPDGRGLVKLRRNLVARLLRRGWGVDERPYRPHLTVARSQVRRDVTPVVDELLAYEGPTWDVDRIAIVASRPGDDGQLRHELIGEYVLTGMR